MDDILKGVDSHVKPSFALKNRVLRSLWWTIYMLFFRFSPRLLHGWRIFLLRCFGARVGRGCHIYPKAEIWAPWNLVMGDYSCFADDVVCYSMARITLGRYCVVSQGARLITGTHDYNDPRFPLVAKEIKMGDEVWIAAEAFISCGVTVNNGAVVGARSVVTRDVPEWTVCAGNPCSVIKERKRKSAG